MEIALRVGALALFFWWLSIVYRQTRYYMLSTNPVQGSPRRFIVGWGIPICGFLVALLALPIFKHIGQPDLGLVVGALAGVANYDEAQRSRRS